MYFVGIEYYPCSGRNEEELDGEVRVEQVDQTFSFHRGSRSVQTEIVDARTPIVSRVWIKLYG